MLPSLKLHLRSMSHHQRCEDESVRLVKKVCESLSLPDSKENQKVFSEMMNAVVLGKSLRSALVDATRELENSQVKFSHLQLKKIELTVVANSKTQYLTILVKTPYSSVIIPLGMRSRKRMRSNRVGNQLRSEKNDTN